MIKTTKTCDCCDGTGKITEEREVRVGDTVSVIDSSWCRQLNGQKYNSIPSRNREDWKVIGLAETKDLLPQGWDGLDRGWRKSGNDAIIQKGEDVVFINKDYLAAPGAWTEHENKRKEAITPSIYYRTPPLYY